MAIRQRGNSWQVDVTWQGQRAPRVACASKAEAERLEAQFRADLMSGRTIDPTRANPGRERAYKGDLGKMGNLFDNVFHLFWRGTKNARTAEINGRAWVDALGQDCDVASLSTEDIAAVCDRWADGGNAAATINRKLAALSKMLSHAHEKGIIDRLPRLPKRKEYAGRIRFFSNAEEDSMLAFFSDDVDMRDAVIMGIDTGFREGELLGLQARDYVSGLLHLWKTKSNAPRAVPATDRVKAILERRCGLLEASDRVFPNPFTARRIAHQMRRWREHHGIPDDTEAVFHATRHTCCSRLIQSNIGLVVAQRWMGHKNIETTLRYAHLAPNALDEARQALNEWR